MKYRKERHAEREREREREREIKEDILVMKIQIVAASLSLFISQLCSK